MPDQATGIRTMLAACERLQEEPAMIYPRASWEFWSIVLTGTGHAVRDGWGWVRARL